jgi:hypothetical protein
MHFARSARVANVAEHDREQWRVTGGSSGKALVEAAARVVDDLADRARAYFDGDI